MKTELLRKIRRRANNEVYISSITRSGSIVTGMTYRYNEDCYNEVFSYGDSENDVMRKVQHIYFENNRERYYKKYKK